MLMDATLTFLLKSAVPVKKAIRLMVLKLTNILVFLLGDPKGGVFLGVNLKI